MTFQLNIRTADEIRAGREDAERDRARARARAYLTETDWMVIRAAETGNPVPDSVAETRAQARRSISGT